MQAAIYILAVSGREQVFVGCCENLAQTVWEHRYGSAYPEGPVALVWYQWSRSHQHAQNRWRQLRTAKHATRRRMIEQVNPHWRDLSDEIN